MKLFESLKKFLIIDDGEDDDVIVVEKAEMEPVKPVIKTEVVADKVEPVVEENPIVTPEVTLEAEDKKQKNTRKLSDIVPSAEPAGVKKPKRRVHINVEDVNKKVKEKKSDSKEIRKYESTPIISPIYGMTEKDNSRVVLATKPETEEATAKAAKKKADSVLDTIISPIFGTNINSDPAIGKVEEKTKVYNDLGENKKETGLKSEFGNEKLSLDDILETPAKKVMKKSEISQNMTIFDDDIKEK